MKNYGRNFVIGMGCILGSAVWGLEACDEGGFHAGSPANDHTAVTEKLYEFTTCEFTDEAAAVTVAARGGAPGPLFNTVSAMVSADEQGDRMTGAVVRFLPDGSFAVLGEDALRGDR